MPQRVEFGQKIDLTEAFFQTLMDPADIEKTAVITPHGAFEWLVMPMGLSNSPPTQQCRINDALRGQIGRICHAYMDDGIVWSDLGPNGELDEHEGRVIEVMDALEKAGLKVSMKKSHFALREVDFLGSHI